MQIEAILRTMNRLSDPERVAIGKHIEEWARETINSRLQGLKWQATSFSSDTKDKRDWMSKGPNGSTLYAQFKGRVSGNDIMLEALMPFHGFGDPRTVVGRDMKYDNVQYYVTYPPMGSHILVSRAKDVKPVVKDLEEEFVDRDASFPFYSRKHRDKTGNKRCELRYKIEEGKGRRNGVPKVLAFLPPELVPHKTIKVDPDDFRAYLVEKLKPRQAHFDFTTQGISG